MWAGNETQALFIRQIVSDQQPLVYAENEGGAEIMLTYGMFAPIIRICENGAYKEYSSGFASKLDSYVRRPCLCWKIKITCRSHPTAVLLAMNTEGVTNRMFFEVGIGPVPYIVYRLPILGREIGQGSGRQT